MTRTYELILNPERIVWENFVSQQENSNIFHSYSWKNVIEKTFGYSPLYLICLESEKVISCIPFFVINPFLTKRRVISLPYSANGGIIGDVKNINIYLDYFKERLQRRYYSHIQIRSDKVLELSNYECSVIDDFIDMELSLKETYEEMWMNFPVSIRTSVRKAEKNNIILVKGRAEKDLKVFYKLNLISRKRFGTPSFSIKYFENILKEFEDSTIYTAYWNGIPVNTNLVINYNKTTYYFYVGADHKYRDKSASDFLVCEMIKDSIVKGQRKINFGRMERKNDSLGFFKKKWGAEEIQLSYYSIPHKSITNKREGILYKLVTNLFKILPVSISSIIGPIFTKELG